MAWSTAARNAAVDAVAKNGGANWFAAFLDNPESGGAEVSGGSYARVAAVYPPATSGTAANDVVEISIPQGTTVKYWARFSTASGGTPYDVRALPGNGETFGGAGTLKVINNVTQSAA